MTDIIQHYKTPAHTLEVGDQVIIDGDECIILSLEDEIDYIYIGVENLGTGPDWFELNPDAEYWIWSI
jgi:hypothetical protein